MRYMNHLNNGTWRIIVSRDGYDTPLLVHVEKKGFRDEMEIENGKVVCSNPASIPEYIFRECRMLMTGKRKTIASLDDYEKIL